MIWFALVVAVAMAASGADFPVMTSVIMLKMTSRMSCCPRMFGSGELYWMRSKPCFPCGTFAH
jgi:H+/Cl- antiporter ClcA